MEIEQYLEKLFDILDSKKKESINKALEAFYNCRISALEENCTYKDPFAEGPKLAIHLIPIMSFRDQLNIDTNVFRKIQEKIAPPILRSFDQTYTFEGLLFSDILSNECISYFHFHRNGTTEAISTREFSDAKKIIYSGSLENNVLEVTNQCLSIQKEMGIDPPIIFFLSLLGVRGYQVPPLHQTIFHNTKHSIDKDSLLFPKLELLKYQVAPEELKPLFDRFWNAGGYPRSQHYDENDIWKH